MPRPIASFPGRRPVDGAKLKATADRLAALLNDLRSEDWHLSSSVGNSWSIIQAPGGAGSAKAVVSETVDGRWETSEVSESFPLDRPSLADRLRALAAEVEAL
jgi:hypothetical protein